MKIHRSTLRADGLTVGEALDRDAAFLRSLGIPAKDGALTFDEKRDELEERVRRAVLAALDAEFPQHKLTDAELPPVFKGLDAYVDRLHRSINLGLS